jgi:hypothetical protein
MTADVEKVPVDFEVPSEEPTVIFSKEIPWAEDPRNPKTWSLAKRSFHTAMPSLLAFEM